VSDERFKLGSEERLFRWGAKSLHDFAANLFIKRCIKFRQNRPSFIEDITKTFWSFWVWVSKKNERKKKRRRQNIKTFRLSSGGL